MIQETHTADILHWLLLGLKSRFSIASKNARFTAKGSYVIIEYGGIFYKITVEPMEGL